MTSQYKAASIRTFGKYISIFFIFLFIILQTTLRSQSHYPQDYFASPLDFPFILSGSFAELRGNHFHSGLDIKTQGVVGKKVYAIADGYVVRIKVSPWGYGNALYIRHPNGYTSVYAHLHRYNDTIADIIKATQYKKKSFAVEIFPKAGSIKVKKGELIAFAGNSGSSGGPHLHFEIRDSRTEEPINPLFFGYKVADHQYPVMRKLRLYNYIDNQSIYNYKEYKISQKGKNIKLISSDTINISTPHFYPAVEGFDRWNAATNKNGYYRLRFFFDDSMFFEFIADKINFSQKRNINSYIDYKEYKNKSQRFQRTYVEENTYLSNIINVRNNGILHITDKKAHKLKIIASDFAGQESVLEFYVRNKGDLKHKERKESTAFMWNHSNTYRNTDIEFSIPKGALFDNQYFWVKSLKNPYSKYSKLHSIYDIGVPLKKYCQLKIKLDSNAKVRNYKKLCIISLDGKDRRVYEGGKYVNGYMETKTRSFGRYYIGIDTIAPIIKPANIYSKKNITKQSTISFTATDNLSGINRYKATLDDKWILLKYDPKKSRLYYEIDEHFPSGSHKFVIKVWDSKSNMSKKEYVLIRN